jgi:hypothetical protein
MLVIKWKKKELRFNIRVIDPTISKIRFIIRNRRWEIKIWKWERLIN